MTCKGFQYLANLILLLQSQKWVLLSQWFFYWKQFSLPGKQSQCFEFEQHRKSMWAVLHTTIYLCMEGFSCLEEENLKLRYLCCILRNIGFSVMMCLNFIQWYKISHFKSEESHIDSKIHSCNVGFCFF